MDQQIQEIKVYTISHISVPKVANYLIPQAILIKECVTILEKTKFSKLSI